MTEFLSGLFTGIATSLVIYIFRTTIGIAFSYFASLFSRSINGKWKTTFSKQNNDFNEHAILHHVGPWVWGVIQYPGKDRVYNFRGTLRADVLAATYEIVGSQSIIDRGSFTLALQRFGDPNKMIGCYSWTDDDSDTPQSDSYIWIKK